MDPQNGYTAISKTALNRIQLDAIFPWYGYCNDLLVRLNVNGFRMRDVVMPVKYGQEKSGIRYKTYIHKVSWMLLKNFFWRLKMKYVVLSFHPLVFFYTLGIVLTPLGILGGWVVRFVLQICGGWTVVCSWRSFIHIVHHGHTVLAVRDAV